MKTKTSEAEGWGLRVGGQRPYLAYEIQRHKDQIKLTESYHRAVRVVLIPAQEWERVKKGMKEEPRHTLDELDRLIDPEPLYNMPPPKMEKKE